MKFDKNEQLVSGIFNQLHDKLGVWPTQKKVAVIMGVSRGTVSGIVTRLKHKKVIETDGHMVVKCRNICELELKTESEEVKSGINWLSLPITTGIYYEKLQSSQAR